VLTDKRISTFYEDVLSLGLKRPVAAIAKETGYSKGNVSLYLSKKLQPSGKFIDRFYEVFKESLKKGPVSSNGNRETPDNDVVKENKSPGYVPAEDLIEVLKEQNEFLRRNFETSLNAIKEGQDQVGVQLKSLSWFSILQAAGGDQQKAEKMLLELNNRIAAYEGEGGEGGSQNTTGKRHTSGRRKD
jgi:transcriptional regulator with XRE-family HTH domain